MTEANVTPRARLDPSVESLRRELILIRGTKEGLGAEAVLEHGHQLQSLPAVDDEMARRDLPPGRRPEATVAVTRCGVNRLVKEPWKTFLRYTLVDPDGLGVEGRKEAARLNLHISSTTERDNIDAKSYRDLARGLMDAELSPCPRDGAARAVELETTIAALRRELAEVYSNLGIDTSADDHRRLARRLDAVLVHGAQALSDVRDIVARVGELISAAVRAHEGDLPHRSQYVPAPLLLFVLVGDVTAVAGMAPEDTDDVELLELQIVDQMDQLWQSERNRPGFETRLANSLTFVADALAYEERHRWPSLNEPGMADLPWLS